MNELADLQLCCIDRWLLQHINPKTRACGTGRYVSGLWLSASALSACDGLIRLLLLEARGQTQLDLVEHLCFVALVSN